MAPWLHTFAVVILAAAPLAAQDVLLKKSSLNLKDFGREGAWFGKSVALSHDSQILVVGAAQSGTRGTRSGAVHLFTLQPSGDWRRDEFPETASDTAAFDAYGYSVAISGDGNTIAVGAPLNDDSKGNAGAVYIWERAGSGWAFRDKVTATGPRANDQLGTSVALSQDGSLLVAGAPQPDPVPNPADGPPGKACIFERQGNEWNERRCLSPAVDAYAFFGFAVAVGGSRDEGGLVIAVGAPGAGERVEAGAAYVLRESGGGNWIPLLLKTGISNDELGTAVAVDAKGSTIAVGARSAGGKGAVYIFDRRPDDAWMERPPLWGTAPGDRFGAAVALDPSGKAVLVGAPQARNRAGNSYLFVHDQRTELPTCASGPGLQEIGQSVALSNLDLSVGFAVAGAPLDSGETGLVCAFDLTGLEVRVELLTDKVVPGLPVRYRITVRNRSSITVSGAHLTIPIDPDLLSEAELSPCPGEKPCRPSGGMLDIPLPELAAAGELVFILEAKVRPEARNEISITAVLDRAGEDLTPNKASAPGERLIPEFSLVIENVVDKERVALRGEVLQYTITVSNRGPSQVNATVTDTFLQPEAVDSISWKSGKRSGNGPLLDRVALPPNVPVTYIVQARTRKGVLVSKLDNLARVEVTAATKLEDTATTHLPLADLTLSISVKEAIPGKPLQILATVTNHGEDAVKDARVEGTVVELSKDWSCVVSQALVKDASATCQDQVELAPELRKSLKIIGHVISPGEVPDPVNNNDAETEVKLNPTSKLSFSLAPASLSGTPGKVIEYDLTVVNAGPSAVRSATLTGQSLQDLTDLQWTCGVCDRSGAGELRDSNVELPVGGEIQYHVTARIQPYARGSLSIEHAVQSSDTNIEYAGKRKLEIGLQPESNIVVTLVAHSSSVYLLWLKNNGPSDLLAGTLEGSFSPEVFSKVKWTCAKFDLTGECNPGEFVPGDAQVEHELRDAVELPAGSLIQYLVRLELLPEVTGTITFEVNLSAGKYEGQDEDVTLDASSITTLIIPIIPQEGG